MFSFENFKPAHQIVVLGVADLRIVEHVVTMVVIIDLGAEALDFARRISGTLRHSGSRGEARQAGADHCRGYPISIRKSSRFLKRIYMLCSFWSAIVVLGSSE